MQGKAELQPCIGDNSNARELASARKALLIIVLVLRFLESFSYFTLNNVFTLHLTEVLGISDAGAGTLFGLRGAVQMLYGVMVGPLVDSLGVSQSLWIAYALCTLGRGIFALATTREMALMAVYGPMAIGHGLVGTVLSIGIKRATRCDNDNPTSASWGFALSYCATVFGIMLCGPFIDAMTILQHPATPYAQLALFTSALSFGMMVLSIAVFHCFPGARTVSTIPRGATERSSVHSGSTSSSNGRDSVNGMLKWLWSLQSTICTRRFARFCAFSIAILPGSSVLRNLDGGIYPKFMLRTFGATVPKGTIYAIEPGLDLILVPLFTKLTASHAHFVVIRAGLCIAAVSPLVIYTFGASLMTVVGFVLVLTLGDALYSARTSAYAMAVAPEGQEGTFAGLSHAVVFFADLPAGLLGGLLLEQFCPQPPPQAMPQFGDSICDGRALFGSLSAFALTTAVLLWCCSGCVREPEALLRGAKNMDASHGRGWAEGTSEGSERSNNESDNCGERRLLVPRASAQAAP